MCVPGINKGTKVQRTLEGALYWKKPARKRKNLIRLGVPNGKAYAFSRTRKGGWAIAQSPILTTTLTLERLGKRGYVCMNDYYEKVSPMFNEPLYPDKIVTQWCERLSLPCFAWWGRLLDYRMPFCLSEDVSGQKLAQTCSLSDL